MNILVNKPLLGWAGPIDDWIDTDVHHAYAQGLISDGGLIRIRMGDILFNNDSINHTALIDLLHINEWCVNEGLADEDDWVDVIWTSELANILGVE